MPSILSHLVRLAATTQGHVPDSISRRPLDWTIGHLGNSQSSFERGYLGEGLGLGKQQDSIFLSDGGQGLVGLEIGMEYLGLSTVS